jgi:hypothetical protein
MHCVHCGERVCWWRGAAVPVLVFTGTRKHIHGIYCMCGDHGQLLGGRVWRGPRVRGRGRATGRLYMQPRLRFNLHDDDRVCRQQQHVPCLRCWLRLRWKWHPGSSLFMLCGLRIDLDDVKRVRRQQRHVFDRWLRPGQRVRWWDGAACRLRMQPRLRLNLHDDDRVRGSHGHLRRLWCRLQLRRKWRPGSTMHMHCRLRIDGYYFICMRHDFFDLLIHGLCRRERVRRRISATGGLHMQPRLRLNINDNDRVCGNHEHLHRLWCRLQVCGKWRAGCGVFVFSWLCVDLDDF